MYRKILFVIYFILSLVLVIDHFFHFEDKFFSIYIGLYFILFISIVALNSHGIPFIDSIRNNQKILFNIWVGSSISLSIFNLFKQFLNIPQVVDNVINCSYIIITAFIANLYLSRRFHKK